MAKASLIVGCFAIALFVGAQFTMRLFVHGEEDWDLGIATALCTVAAIVLGLASAIVFVIATRPRRRNDDPHDP